MIIDLSGVPLPDAIGVGFEGSATLGGGANYGAELLFFTRGPKAFTPFLYGKLGVNLGLEASIGFYGFTADFPGKEADITNESWRGGLVLFL